MSRSLAERVIACEGFRWMPGMLGSWSDGYKRITVRYDLQGSHPWTRSRTALPDLDDPATLGCLLALVRDAWEEPKAYTDPEAFADAGHSPGSAVSVWGVWGANDRSMGDGLTEGEALVAALEAAPKKEAA